MGREKDRRQYGTVAQSGKAQTPAGTPDYVTNLVAKYRSGDDANFALTGTDIDTITEQLGGNTDKDIIFVGGGGYSTKAKHRADIGINGDKVIEVMGAGEYRTRAGGTTLDFFSGANASFVLVFRIHSIVAAFGTPDCILVDASNDIKIEAINSSGAKLQFTGSNSGAAITAAITLDTWQIARCRFDAADDKAKVTLGDAAEVVGTAGTAFPQGNGRWYFLANSGSGARSDICVHLLAIYDELLTDENWEIKKTYERSLHAAIA